MAIVSAQTRTEFGFHVWRLVRLPLRILLIGLSVILLFSIWGWLGLPSLGGLVAWFTTGTGPNPPSLDPSATLAAILVMISGLSVVGLLWWLIDRYFSLISKGKVPPDPTTMRDLPLGLPEGTIRSVLALFVAVVGLPILIFSHTLHLDNAIAGYVNGIIAGVFGFYFGSRSSTSATQAVVQAAAASRLLDATSTAAAAASISEIAGERDAAVRAGEAGPTLDRLTRHLELAAVLVDPIGPLMPAGLVPPNLKTAVSAAESALAALGTGTPGPETMQRAKDAADGLISASPLDRLIKTAAPHAGASPAMLAALLGLGWNLGATAYQRWYALLLGAPISGPIDGGTLTQDEIAAAATAIGDLPAVWTAAMQESGFRARLPDLVLATNAVDRVWAEFSAPATTDKGVFDNRAQIVAGLDPLRLEILAGRLGRDISDDLLKPVLDTLGGTADADLQAASGVDAAGLLKAAREAGKSSATAAGSDSVRAAFDALVTLVGIARKSNVDLPKTLSEVLA